VEAIQSITGFSLLTVMAFWGMSAGAQETQTQHAKKEDCSANQEPGKDQ
jgi:hypothetical protein